MNAACPTCGRPKELPRITPERLFFLCGDAVRRFAVMPGAEGDDLYVVAVHDVAHTIRPAEFAHYQAMCRHSADFTAAAA